MCDQPNYLPMKTDQKHLLWISIVLTFSLFVSGCKTSKVDEYGNKLGEIQEKADPVKTQGELLKTGEFALELVSNGKLEATKKASLFFQRSDLVAQIHVKNGQWVELGARIANLNSDAVEVGLEQAATGVEKARINLRDLLIGHSGGSDSEEGINAKALETMRIKSGFRDAELNLKARQLDYQQCYLSAPVAGRVAGMESKANNLPPTGKPFCMIIDDREFEVVFPVMESELSEVIVGQEVTIKPFAYDSLTVMGRITDVNPMVDEHGMVRIKATIPNKYRKLVEGMNVKVFIRYKVPAGMIIPKEALVLRNNRQVVFSLKNGRSYWNYVHTGFENSSQYTITVESGVLEVGDTIITKGNLNLAHDADLDFQFIEH